jgi:hypothetical protein
MRDQAGWDDSWTAAGAANTTDGVRPWKSQLLKWVGT